MASGLRLVTPATLQLFEIEKLRARVRANQDQDELIEELLGEATDRVGDDTRRQLLTATWDQSEASFADFIRLRKAPVQSITWVKYLGTDGELHTVEPGVYRLANIVEPCVLTPAVDEAWPTDVAEGPDVVQVRFVAGWTSASLVPRALKGAAAMLVAHWLEHPEAVVHGTIMTEAPLGYDDLVADQYYVWEF